jgi:hypothetical protein
VTVDRASACTTYPSSLRRRTAGRPGCSATQSAHTRDACAPTVTVRQQAGDLRFASLVQLLETRDGERLVRFAYSTGGNVRRGPVTLRARDVVRLHAQLAQHPALSEALGL